MTTKNKQAAREFRRMMKWIVAIAVTTALGALAFEAYQGVLGLHMGIATVLGVFFSMTLGAGLFALAFFSDKSGHDDIVTAATKRPDNC